MSELPRTYNERRSVIAAVLEPYFNVSAMQPTNTRPHSVDADEFYAHSLWCSSGDRKTGNTRTVTVSIEEATDGRQEADEIRDMMREECSSGLNFERPNFEAYEIAGTPPGEHVFVLEYLGRLTAIVGNCLIHIMPKGTGVALGSLVDPALDIGRTIGCSAYENDFESPDVPDGRGDQPKGWTVEGGPPFIPGSVEAEPE